MHLSHFDWSRLVQGLEIQATLYTSFKDATLSEVNVCIQAQLQIILSQNSGRGKISPNYATLRHVLCPSAWQSILLHFGYIYTPHVN